MDEVSIEGWISKNTFNKHGTQAVAFETQNHLVIAFRGTEPTEMSDIISDLKSWQTDSESGTGDVHVGFKEALDRIWNDLEKWVEARPNKSIITCGHSLGGALATLSAQRLNASECYTYGSPRVGDAKWLTTFKTKHFRVVNNNDVVPKVPLWVMGFRHTCEPIYLSYAGKIVTMTKLQRFIDSLRGRIKAASKFQFFDAIYDHSMSEYIRFLNKNI